MARRMRTADHLEAIDGRLARLDAKVDERFAGVDARFGEVDKRFERVDERVDEEHSHFNALFEASRADFNNLYDFVKAQAERTDARFDQLQAEMRTRFADLQSAIAGLVRVRRTGGRRRH